MQVPLHAAADDLAFNGRDVIFQHDVMDRLLELRAQLASDDAAWVQAGPP